MKTTQKNILVSVCCITYNHSAFIEEALESFLMQKCNFDIEILIGDDCSTDGSSEIIDSYVAKYPDRLRKISPPYNYGPNKNVANVTYQSKGKYIALCDGDDYWTDPYKLQKQVDFMEKNDGYVMCCHYTKEINANNELIYMNFKPVPLQYTFSDLMVSKQVETCTATIMYRNTDSVRTFYLSDWFLSCSACDKFLKLYTTWITGKKVYVLPEVMSCYRRHQGGIWSPTPPIPLKKRQLNDFYLIAESFTYTGVQKVQLLYFYLKKYFLFEVKYKTFNDAFGTIKSILN